jgi:predicted GNAT superfamily acetyltransferase
MCNQFIGWEGQSDENLDQGIGSDRLMAELWTVHLLEREADRN